MPSSMASGWPRRIVIQVERHRSECELEEPRVDQRIGGQAGGDLHELQRDTRDFRRQNSWRHTVHRETGHRAWPPGLRDVLSMSLNPCIAWTSENSLMPMAGKKKPFRVVEGTIADFYDDAVFALPDVVGCHRLKQRQIPDVDVIAVCRSTRTAAGVVPPVTGEICGASNPVRRKSGLLAGLGRQKTCSGGGAGRGGKRMEK